MTTATTPEPNASPDTPANSIPVLISDVIIWTRYASPTYLSCQKIVNFTAFGVPQEQLSMFSGSIPALVTPFDAVGAFDERAFRDLVEWQIVEGSTGLVPCGTTGESVVSQACARPGNDGFADGPGGRWAA